MGKTKRKAAICSSKNASASSEHTGVNQIILHSKSEMEVHIEKWEAQTNDMIKKLRREMHTVISSLPSELGMMTVEDFINSYSNSSKQTTSSEKTTLQDVENISNNLPVPLGACIDDSSKPVPTKSKSRKRVPATTKSSRSRRKLETPSRCPFVMVEGTPMLTKRDTSHLNLSEKPRRMRRTDDISAVQLTLYSGRGSPMMMENMDEEMRRKIQESINMMMSAP